MSRSSSRRSPPMATVRASASRVARMARWAWWSRDGPAPRDAERVGDLSRAAAQGLHDEDRPLVGRYRRVRARELVADRPRRGSSPSLRSVDPEDLEVDEATTFARRLRDAGVDEHLTEPGVELVRIAEPTQVAPGDDQRILQGILGPIHAPSMRQAMAQSRSLRGTDQVHVASRSRLRLLHHIAIYPSRSSSGSHRGRRPPLSGRCRLSSLVHSWRNRGDQNRPAGHPTASTRLTPRDKPMGH